LAEAEKKLDGHGSRQPADAAGLHLLHPATTHILPDLSFAWLSPLQDIRNLFFTRAGTNLAGYYTTCSYGRAKLSPETTLVLGPITMPCNGTNKNISWTVTNCSPADYYGWQFWLEAWATSQGYDLTPYRHRVVLLPKGQQSFMAPGSSDCTWTGLAIVGPVGECHAAITCRV
jgi:hypothetical protein